VLHAGKQVFLKSRGKSIPCSQFCSDALGRVQVAASAKRGNCARNRLGKVD
jgi:hypothetical protein